MKITGVGFILTVALLLPASAGAVQTFSPPVLNNSVAVLACAAQNLGDLDVAVTATLRRGDGTVIDSDTVSIPAGRSAEIATASEDTTDYCVFEFDADPATVRTYVHRRPAAGGDTIVLFPAFEIAAGAEKNIQTYTAPLRSIGSENLLCVLQNLSGNPIDVDTDLLDANGGIVDSDSEQVPAGAARTVLFWADDLISAYCRFGFNGDPERIRGYIIQYSGTGSRMVLPASPATSVGDVVKYSPPIYTPSGAATACIAQNLGALAIQVSAELIDTTGLVLDSGTEFVSPGDVESIAGTTDEAEQAICKFVFGAAGNPGRGYITNFPTGAFSSTRSLEPAVGAGGMAQTGVTTYSLPVRNADQRLTCTLENLSDEMVAVHVEIDDGTGTIVAMQDINASPGRGRFGVATLQDLDAGVCRFSFDGNPDEIRGFATLQAPGQFATFQVLAARPLGAPNPSLTPTRTSPPTFTHTFTRTATATPTLTATATPTRTPTVTPTATHAPTNTFSKTATATPTQTSTLTGTVTPTNTPTPTTPECVGDCDGDGSVTVDEILKMVNIALGTISIDDCTAGDSTGDEDITVDEILTAVTNALDGC